MQKKRKIIIYDNEIDYSRRLQEYMNEKYSDLFETHLFTSKMYVAKFLQENIADVLLTSENNEFNCMENVKEIIYLTSEKKASTSMKEIYKYSSAKSIVAAVIDIISKMKDEGIDDAGKSGKKAEIIGVYSPLKRCFQTTFCITLGQILAKKKKVLYLNFEGFSGFDYLSVGTYKADLIDALYFAECGISSFAVRVESMVERIGDLRYIAPTKAFTNLTAISPLQWNKLLDAILSETDYEVIIMDLSEQVNGLLDILDRCSRVFTIVDEERMSKAKVAQYQMLLREKKYDGIITKTQSIIIPRFKEIPADFEMLPYSELTNYVKRIIQEESRSKAENL